MATDLVQAGCPLQFAGDAITASSQGVPARARATAREAWLRPGHGHHAVSRRICSASRATVRPRRSSSSPVRHPSDRRSGHGANRPWPGAGVWMSSRLNNARTMLAPPPIMALRSHACPAMRRRSAALCGNQPAFDPATPVRRDGNGARGPRAAAQGLSVMALKSSSRTRGRCPTGLGARYLSSASSSAARATTSAAAKAFLTGELAVGEIARGPGNLPTRHDSISLGWSALARMRFGGACRNVDHQSGVHWTGAASWPRHLSRSSRCLFAPGDHVDETPARRWRAAGRSSRLRAFAQGLCGDRSPLPDGVNPASHHQSVPDNPNQPVCTFPW